jgi:hypothetical protein
MRIIGPYDISNVTSWEELRRFGSQLTKALVDIVNGKITFVDNFDALTASVVFTAPNTTVLVPHGLDRVPSGYMIQSLSAAMIIYDGNQANTTHALYVQSSAIGTANLLIY